jgi:uncharacterized protein YggE
MRGVEVRTLLILVWANTCVPASALAEVQQPVPQASGLRLDVVAVGEVTRLPDEVSVLAGVITRAPQASAALQDNSQLMERVRAALRRLGIQDRDVQTGTISLTQDYERLRQPPPPERPDPSGYAASNQLTIRFRNVSAAGRIIDALVAEGVNNVRGPMFGLSDQASALDEARTKALTIARERADLYARSLRSRVRRIVSVSESGQHGIVVAGEARGMATNSGTSTSIEPGEQIVSTSVTVTFELDQPQR